MEQTKLNDLIAAHQELINHHKDIEKCTNDLKVAKEKLNIEEIEKEERAVQVNKDLEDMMFTISHRVRKSIAKILGISHLLFDDSSLGVEELRDMLKIIIESAESLNNSTEELSKFIRKSQN